MAVRGSSGVTRLYVAKRTVRLELLRPLSDKDEGAREKPDTPSNGHPSKHLHRGAGLGSEGRPRLLAVGCGRGSPACRPASAPQLPRCLPEIARVR
jgi:hypothetical protein